MLTAADVTAIRSALLFACRALAARNEDTTAFVSALAAVDATTTEHGSVSETGCNHGYVDTCEASRLLGTSERWVRELAASGHIGAVKHAGRWLIPRDALPEDD